MGPSRLALSKPVIAAVSGHAVAGGLELALWCDLRVVESDAVFGVFCRRWGVPLIDGGTVRLPRVVGLGRALDLILTGRPVDAAEALAIGLANRVVAPGTRARRPRRSPAAGRVTRSSACARTVARSTTRSDVGEQAALEQEFAHGQQVLAAGARARRRFAEGAGRHGSPARPDSG